MKTTATMIALAIATFGYSQQAAITNGFDGFENWANAETGELPEYWDGFNKNVQFNGMTVGTIECIEKSSADPYEGMYSVQLTSTSIMGGPAVPAILTVGDFVVDWNAQDGDIEGGEAYTQKPTQLTGQFKYTPNGVDTGFVSVWFMQNGLEVGSGRFEFTETSGGWTAFTVDITYYDPLVVPDSMNLMFSSSQSDASSVPVGTVLEIDAISFGSFVSTNELNLDRTEVYPNPAKEEININVKEEVRGKATLMDAAGRLVRSKQINGTQAAINVSDLPSGMYQLVVSDKNGSLTKAVIVE